MKKLIAITAAMVLLAVVAVPVLAHRNGCNGGNCGGNGNGGDDGSLRIHNSASIRNRVNTQSSTGYNSVGMAFGSRIRTGDAWADGSEPHFLYQFDLN